MSETIDVRALREQLGWTQEQMAAEIGLDRSAVSRLENGQTPSGPTLILLRQIAQRASSHPAPPQTTGGES